jgi:hypothetical protein
MRWRASSELLLPQYGRFPQKSLTLRNFVRFLSSGLSNSMALYQQNIRSCATFPSSDGNARFFSCFDFSKALLGFRPRRLTCS